ncbi:MAG: DMT family transporter [Ilumatobacteraceae bacterium]
MSRTPRSPRTLGFIALGLAIVCFSLGSTIVKKAGIPGSTLAFWRMVLTSVLWSLILWFSERSTITRADLRRALVPGIIFGLNITAFFTGVTNTSVANAEFIGTLTPLVLVPAGAIFFKEKINGRALWFGLISLLGLVIVLFNTPTNSVATWAGNITILVAMLLWASYLLTSRRLRGGDMSVYRIMAAIMPIATLTILPITLVQGTFTEVTAHSVPYIVLLAVMTGTVAHGMIVYAQHTVPVGTIGILQVAQPALAVCWAYLLLGQTIVPIQIVGMVLVVIGLAAVVTVTRRAASPAPEFEAEPLAGPLAEPPRKHR